MKKPLIQSLERALDILEIVRDGNGPVRASAVARQAGLRVATASNIVRTLYQRGYLAQDENHRYLLGASCYKLYNAASDRFSEVRRVVSGVVRELAEATGDTTFFGCECHGSLYCIAISIGDGHLVVSPHQSWLDLLHCTAAGKVVIAEKGVEWYSDLCRQQPPKALTPRTITTPAAMATEITTIRETGYALSVGECAEEIAALGVAVRNRAGELVGALSQSFPALYLENGRVEPVTRAAMLQRHAERIGDGL
jgi:DNA-binding IclR family transcriptional regulator